MRLIGGVGSPTRGACWMSAIFYYTEYNPNAYTPTWHDHPACVSPVVRQLCITLNDWCPSIKERERMIGPHLFAPLGTKYEDDTKRVKVLEEELVRLDRERFGAVRKIESYTDLYETTQLAKYYWKDIRRQGPAGREWLLGVILKLCAIGTPQEVTPRCTKEELFERLEK